MIPSPYETGDLLRLTRDGEAWEQRNYEIDELVPYIGSSFEVIGKKSSMGREIEYIIVRPLTNREEWRYSHAGWHPDRFEPL